MKVILNTTRSVDVTGGLFIGMTELNSLTNLYSLLRPAALHLCQKVMLGLNENGPTSSHLCYYLSKHLPNYFIVSVAGFKPPLMQCDVHVAHYGPI